MNIDLKTVFKNYISQNGQSATETTTAPAASETSTPLAQSGDDGGSSIMTTVSTPAQANDVLTFVDYDTAYNEFVNTIGSDFADILADGNIDDEEQQYLRDNNLQDEFLGRFSTFDGFDDFAQDSLYSVIKSSDLEAQEDDNDNSNANSASNSNLNVSATIHLESDSQAVLAGDVLENMLGEDTLETLATTSEVITSTFDIDENINISEIEQLNAPEIKDFYDSRFTPILNKAQENERLAIDNFYLSLDEKTKARNAYIDTTTQCTTKSNELALLKAQLSGKGSGLDEQDELQAKNDENLEDNRAGINSLNSQISIITSRIQEQSSLVSNAAKELHNAELNYAICKANPPLNDGTSADFFKQKSLNDAKNAYLNAKRAYETQQAKLNAMQNSADSLDENKDKLESQNSDLQETNTNIALQIKMGDGTYTELQKRVEKADKELQILLQARDMANQHLEDTETNANIAEINMNKAIAARIEMDSKKGEILNIYRAKLNSQDDIYENEQAEESEEHDVLESEVEANQIHDSFIEENRQYLDNDRGI